MPTITGHAGLAGNTSGDENDLSALKSRGKARGSGLMADDLFVYQRVVRRRHRVVDRTSLLVLMWPMSAATPLHIC
jgi:hypothetical protein